MGWIRQTKKWMFLLAGIGTTLLLHAQVEVMQLPLTGETIAGGSKLAYIAVEQDELSIQDLRSMQPNMKTLDAAFVNFGIARTNYLFYCSFENKSAQQLKYYFELSNPRLDLLQFFHVKGDSILSTSMQGDFLPFGSRPLLYNYFVFPFTADQGQHDMFVFIRHKGHTMNHIRFTIWPEREFFAHASSEYFFMGTMLGIGILACLIGLYLFSQSREKIYFSYAFYVILSVLWLLARDGYGYQYIWSNTPWWNTTAGSAIMAFAFFFLASTHLAILDKNGYILRRVSWLQILKWSCLAGGLLALIPIDALRTPDATGTYLYLFIILYFLLLLSLLYAHFSVIARSKEVLLFTVAALFKMLVIIAVMITEVFFPYAIFKMEHFFSLALLFEISLLAFALIRSFYIHKKQNLLLQNKLSEQEASFSHDLISIQEVERSRLARDLHDDLGATLSSLKLHFGNAPLPIQDAAPLFLTKSIEIVNKATADLRQISHDLLPADFIEQGLFDVLRQRVSFLNANGPMRFVLIVEGDEKELPAITSINLYRIINEILNNAIRHSYASEVTVQVAVFDAMCQLIIEDNGIGFAGKDTVSGIGLKNIQLRVRFLKGTVTIDTGNRGSSFIIEIPLYDSSR